VLVVQDLRGGLRPPSRRREPQLHDVGVSSSRSTSATPIRAVVQSSPSSRYTRACEHRPATLASRGPTVFGASPPRAPLQKKRPCSTSRRAGQCGPRRSDSLLLTPLTATRPRDWRSWRLRACCRRSRLSDTTPPPPPTQPRFGLFALHHNRVLHHKVVFPTLSRSNLGCAQPSGGGAVQKLAPHRRPGLRVSLQYSSDETCSAGIFRASRTRSALGALHGGSGDGHHGPLHDVPGSVATFPRLRHGVVGVLPELLGYTCRALHVHSCWRSLPGSDLEHDYHEGCARSFFSSAATSLPPTTPVVWAWWGRFYRPGYATTVRTGPQLTPTPHALQRNGTRRHGSRALTNGLRPRLLFSSPAAWQLRNHTSAIATRAIMVAFVGNGQLAGGGGSPSDATG